MILFSEMKTYDVGAGLNQSADFTKIRFNWDITEIRKHKSGRCWFVRRSTPICIYKQPGQQ
jgi:hypothetical protein